MYTYDIGVPLFKMWSMEDCVQYVVYTSHLLRKCVLSHDVRESIYLHSSSRNWTGWSIMKLILRVWLYIKFCPLIQGLLSLRAKSPVGARSKNWTSCPVFWCMLLKISLVLLSYHRLSHVIFSPGSLNIMKTKSW